MGRHRHYNKQVLTWGELLCPLRGKHGGSWRNVKRAKEAGKKQKRKAGASAPWRGVLQSICPNLLPSLHRLDCSVCI